MSALDSIVSLEEHLRSGEQDAWLMAERHRLLERARNWPDPFERPHEYVLVPWDNGQWAVWQPGAPARDPVAGILLRPVVRHLLSGVSVVLTFEDAEYAADYVEMLNFARKRRKVRDGAIKEQQVEESYRRIRR